MDPAILTATLTIIGTVLAVGIAPAGLIMRSTTRTDRRMDRFDDAMATFRAEMQRLAERRSRVEGRLDERDSAADRSRSPVFAGEPGHLVRAQPAPFADRPLDRLRESREAPESVRRPTDLGGGARLSERTIARGGTWCRECEPPETRTYPCRWPDCDAQVSVTRRPSAPGARPRYCPPHRLLARRGRTRPGHAVQPFHREPTRSSRHSPDRLGGQVLFVALSRGTPRGFDRIVPVTEFLG